MADLMEYVNMLADRIGPRPVSTEEENQASLFIAQELTDRGLDVSVDEFATPTGVRWPYVVACGLVALGTYVSGIGIFVPGIMLTMYILGLLFVVAGVFVFFTEWNNQPYLSKMRAGGISQNVVAKYVPSSMARETRRRKVIIAAHVDTVRARPEDSPKLVKYAPLLRKIMFYCMAGIGGAYIIRLLPIPWPEVIDTVIWALTVVGSLYLIAVAVCIIISHFTPFISGGNDNASSVAVMLSVADLLVDPEERARYMAERPAVQSQEFEDEGYELDESGALEFEFDDLDEPVMHSAEEAGEAGLADDFEVVYDDDAVRTDATVAFPSLAPEAQLGVLADTSAEELHTDTVNTVPFSLDDVQNGTEIPMEDSLPEIKVPALEVDFDRIDGGQRRAETPRVDDSIVFADYMTSNEPEPEEEPVEELELEVEVAEEPVEQEPVEAPAPAPVYVPIKPAAPAQNMRQPVSRPVPAWYASAKKKAAEDRARREEEEAAAAVEEEPTLTYRSRFADTPINPTREMPVEEEIPTRIKNLENTYEEVLEVEQEAQAQVEPAVAEPVVEPEKVEVVELNFELSDDEIDDLNPDASGMFAPVSINVDLDDTPKRADSQPAQLTSRIPNIGSSDDKVREERKVAAEERAARGFRSELSGIPVMEDEVVSSESAAAVVPERTRERAPLSSTREERRPDGRGKPTARRVTESFTPTRAVDADHKFGDNRQESPISSTYESTPQAAPASDPFEPKDEFRAEPAQPATRTRATYTSTTTARFQANSYEAPSNTGSFPSLTGSFPSLSGSMPVIEVDDYSEPRRAIASDEALDSFMASGQTSDIEIPESRFRNTLDKVGGIFNRKGKNRDAAADNAWNDEDDYGWKGGAYFEEEAESAFDAARERAAQIRESVISMTESDLLDKEVWFVALGASSAGQQGMKNFLDLHASELRGSLIINLEAIGAGDICYVETEGTGAVRRADRRLMSLVKKASKELTGREMRRKNLDWRNTDASPAMRSGMRALTIMGFDEENGVAPVNWHCATDTSEIVEEENLENMTRLLLKVIENS